jgi:signal transduction histidine kinase
MPPDPIYVFADPVRLAQVIQNLLNDALRYGPAGGKIWLPAIRDGDNARKVGTRPCPCRPPTLRRQRGHTVASWW